ncbi:MAG: response regulator [Herpetosiphonaceae bacterium]|nr:MAG: response regulator [Herpetosiphonaceae bacterium]
MTPESPSQLHLRRAAIVDDSGEFQVLAQMMLDYIGVSEIRCYSFASEALPALLESPPDLLLLDQMMAGIDGITLLKQLRGHAATARLPVIICTAAINRFLDQEEQLRTDPYTAVLAKPFSIEELQAVLTRLIPLMNTTS